MSESIGHLTEIVGELETKYAEMKRELDELNEAKYEARKDLFRAHYENAKTAENKEEATLAFLKYILGAPNDVLKMWPIEGDEINGLESMCKGLVKSSTSSLELVSAGERVLKRIETWLSSSGFIVE
jgi:hypothetical protein